MPEPLQQAGRLASIMLTVCAAFIRKLSLSKVVCAEIMTQAVANGCNIAAMASALCTLVWQNISAVADISLYYDVRTRHSLEVPDCLPMPTP